MTNFFSRTRVEVLVLLVAWLLFLVLALRTFAPDGVYNHFQSDAAIPVLMANDDRPINIFDTYYYAADRWGGWPLIVAKAVHLNFGLHWTEQSLYYVRTIWMFLGLLVLAALNARAAPAVVVSALIVLCLEPTSRRIMFDLSQLYGWQLTALFLAWFCLRRLLSVRVHGIFWSAAFYVAALFAIWSSIMSAPLLSVVMVLEALRFQKTITKRRLGLAVVLLFAATASEFLLKKNYHRHSLKHFGNEFKTGFALDFGHFSENLLTNWHNITQYTFFPLIVVALCFVVGIAGWILYGLVSGKELLKNRVLSLLEDETVATIIALTLMAIVNFAILCSINHVRTSDYDVRFHALTYLFSTVSGLLAIYFGIRVLMNRVAAIRYVLPLVVAGAFIYLFVNFPPRTSSELYREYRETALALSQKAPGSVLMGGYWETYVFVALQPTGIMTPVPFEGVLNRIPWTISSLRDSQQVVIEYRTSNLAPKDLVPPNQLRQYGNLLKLQDAHFYEHGPYAFALYLNERSQP